MKRPSTALKFLTTKKLKYALLFNEESVTILHFLKVEVLLPIDNFSNIVKMIPNCVEGIKVLDDNICRTAYKTSS